MKTPVVYPIGSRVLVQRLAPEQLSSTLVIPDIVDQRSDKFKVLMTGPGTFNRKTGKYDPPEVKPGDVVLLGKYSGQEVSFGGTTAVFVDESEILAVVES